MALCQQVNANRPPCLCLTSHLQVAAMEARAQAIGAPPLRYMFPQNSNVNAADAQMAVKLGLPIERLMPGERCGLCIAVQCDE